MKRNAAEKNIGNTNEHSDVDADVRTEGMPNWAERELSSDHIDAGKPRPGFDKPFLLITLVLLLIGLVMVLSASFASAYYTSGEPLRFFSRQLIFAVSGVALMLIVSNVNVRTMSRWSSHLLLISIALLILVLIIGIRINGARRWMGVGGESSSLTFQPSEIAKLAIILAYAQMVCKFGVKRMKTAKFGVAPFVSITVIIIVLLSRQPHFSAAIIIAALSAVMMFAGGTRLRWFLLAGILAIIAAGILLFPNIVSIAREGGVNSVVEHTSRTQIDFGRFGYAGRRIGAWLDPEADPLRDGFQIRQSLYAVGSGGWLGQGLGQSRQKYLYLPEEHNDYIFAIVCEELGFIGAVLILMLFVLLIVRGYWLALNANDKFSSLIVIGITSLLAIQVFLNVAVVINLVPATGISLPFFSYGGTALWIQLVQIGIVLAVSRDIPLYKPKPDVDELEIAE